MKCEESKNARNAKNFKILKKLKIATMPSCTLQYNFNSYNSEGDIYSSNHSCTVVQQL